MTPIFDSDRAFFNKWEMHQMMNEKTVPYFTIPRTDMFSLPSLEKYINLYQSVFIKPVASWGGQNISKVTKQKQQLVWTLQGQPPKSFIALDHLFAELLSSYGDELCIIQQEAPLITCDNRPFDIRTHMQHDLEDGWIYSGDLVRMGGSGSVVSNVAISNGSVKPTVDVLSLLFEGLAPKITQDLAAASMHICEQLDQHYFFLEAGIDFGVDRSGGLWLIEVNTNDLLGGPDQTLFEELPDKTYFNDMVKRKERINGQTIQKLLELYEESLKDNNSNPK
ncbi:hypothetical protein AC623_01650 [Bacillus sp. FJAT-27231]|uniref:YheC/YheD family protein n=1 Tax=Bacillus sp. FJAT-27231 TaxID=1679168 RepID=UPI000670F5EF|nr:YheC/YheD family protein [Bacillus sp. FJAT-27231]KMY52846.1 hypothetical protein AC623_01650 [Bacillus sp. FJAT-27231]